MSYPTPTNITNAQSRLETLLQDGIVYNTEQFILLGGTATTILDGIKSVSNTTVDILCSNTEAAFVYRLTDFGTSSANLSIAIVDTLESVYIISANLANYANLSPINSYLDAIANNASNINDSLVSYMSIIETKLDAVSSTLASSVKVISALNSNIVMQVSQGVFPVGVSKIVDGIRAGSSANDIGRVITGPYVVSTLNNMKSELYASNSAISNVSSVLSTSIMPAVANLKLLT
jgi:hypothetical protein